MKRIIIVFFLSYVQSCCLFGQDKLFLRDNDIILDCYILQADDSLIVFRLADVDSKTIYEIPYAATYGFVLEVKKDLETTKAPLDLAFQFSHPEKKRKPIIRTQNTIIFKLKTDSSFYPRSGTLVFVDADSMQVEFKKRKHVHRTSFSIEDVQWFAYTNVITELMTLIIFPISSNNDPYARFYRKLDLRKGWKHELIPAPIRMRKRDSNKKIRLPDLVRKRNIRRDN